MTVAAETNRITGNGALIQQPQKLITQDDSPIAYIMDTARFEHTQRIAKMMSITAFMPKHLVGGTPERAVANCMMVLNQAMRWQMDPFSVAPETYEVQGKLSYQGKLVAAVVNARGKLKQSLDVVYSTGKGDDLAAVIYGSRQEIPKEAKDYLKKYANDEDHDALLELKFMGIMAIRVTVGQCKTKNTMWSTDPTQKLFYTGATKWARRYAPELMLGVITDEDIERMNYAGQIHSPEGAQLRTLDELTKKLEAQGPSGVVLDIPETTEVTPKKPEAEKEDEDKPIPEWVSTITNKINEALRTTILEPIGEELLNDYKNPDCPEPDKVEFFPILFKAWAGKMGSIVKAADKPRVKAKIEGWDKYLPPELHDDVMALIN